MKNDRYYLNCITFGRAAEGLRADFQRQLVQMQKEIGFSYVRFHGLFHDDMAVYHEEAGQKPHLWFGYVDKLFDFLLENGLKPFVELGFMPRALAVQPDTVFWWHANGSPPKDYAKWHFLVQGTVRHLVERYGLDEVKTWYFEVWNEPNLSSFWQGTQAAYFELYRVSVDAVKSVCSALKVGGPSTSGADFREDLQYFKSFIDFCSQNKLPVDFFSAHPYPTYWPLDTNGNEQMGYMSKQVCAEFLSAVKNIVARSPYAGAQIHLTEWNSSPSPRDLVHDTPFEAPFILYNITQNFGKVDSLAYWAFTDIFEENGPGEQPFHGGFGLINADGIRKPSYWAYWFLAQLGDEIVSVSDTYVVARRGEDYQVILWNYCDYTPAFAAGDRSALSLTQRDGVFLQKPQQISVRLDLHGDYKQTEYCLNRQTSALHNWVKMGAPQYLTKAQAAQLQAESVPQCQVRNTKGFCLCETLAPHEARLYLLEKVHNA